jgi:serine/threonine protein kinase
MSSTSPTARRLTGSSNLHELHVTLARGFKIAQYEILESIGAGGMGAVYRAKDSRLGRDVAIKVMAPHVAADPEMRRRFETEARAIAALSHSSIVAIHELAILNELPVAVMELLEGHTLRDRLKSSSLPWQESGLIAATVCDGLAAAHARGIVHRDLKPENIFLTKDGAVKILDFGLALRRNAMPAGLGEGPTVAQTAANIVLGTVGYMSPEQVTGDPVDPRSDLFALGCVLYEMVAGQPRFAGSTAQEVIARLMIDSAHDLTSIESVAPRELAAVISRCIQRLPSNRFQSAAEVASALRRLLSGSVHATTGGVGAVRRPRGRGKSIAVLPFVNTGADPATEYLTNGITENIINSLSQLGGLRVVPRSLVFRYAGQQADPTTMGLALNARTILTGRVSPQGEHLNIQAELVDTSSESQIWGEQFRPKLSELANVQQEIAWQISEALRLKLTGAQKKKLKRRAKVDPEAYQEYLRGRHFFHSWSPDGFRRALEHFARAIDLDPTYAPAYAGMGDTIGCMSYYGIVPPEDGFPRAQAAAHRAIELDPDLAEAHGTLGIGTLFFMWDWTRSEQHFEKSIALNPGLASVRAFYALMLSTAGRHAEALEQARIGRQADPLSPFVNMCVGWVVFFSGRCEEAVAELHHIREMLRGDSRDEAGSILIVAYEVLGRYEEAARTALTSACFGVPLDGEALLRAWQQGGAPAYWAERLAALDRAPLPRSLIHYNYGAVLAQAGQLEEAVEHLEKLVDLHHGGPVFFAVDPALRPLAGHSRFEALLSRIGAPRPTRA